MAAFISTGGSISWGGYIITPRSIAFNSASAEVVTIPFLYTSKNTPPVVVPTGDFQGGGISVEFIKQLGDVNFAQAVGLSAPWTYTDEKGYALAGTNMLLVSCTENPAVGSVVTGTLEFVLTSFSGNNWS